MAKRRASDNDLIEEGKEREELSRSRFEQRIQARKLLAEHQPIVYRMLNQAIHDKNVSHAYLFQGTKGCLKTEAAVLFAQSLFCGADGLIEEEKLDDKQALIARRVAEGNYGDFLFLNGYRKESISRDEISEIQSLFSKTSMEESQHKVYVMDHAENTSISAMNGILKFLEEPADNVHAILTTDNVERLLPTIVSRCVVVPFRPLAPSVYQKLMKEEGLDEEDIYLLHRIVDTTYGFQEIAASRTYQIAKDMLKQLIGAKGNPDLFLVDYEVRYRLRPKDVTGDDKASAARDANLDTLLYFFGMLIEFYKDVIRKRSDGPLWYSRAVENAAQNKNVNYAQCMAIAVEERDRCNRNNDLNLLLAQMLYRLEASKNV